MDVTEYERPVWAVGQRVLPNGVVYDVDAKGEMKINDAWKAAHPDLAENTAPIDTTKEKPRKK